MRLSIGVKLLGGFGVVIGLTALIMAIALYNLSVLTDLAARVYAQELTAIKHVSDAREAANRYHLATVQLIEQTDAAERERQMVVRSIAAQELEAEFTELQEVFSTSEGSDLLTQTQAAWTQYKSTADQLVAASAAGNVAEAHRLNQTSARQGREAISMLLDQITSYKDRRAEENVQSAIQTYVNVRTTTLVLLIVPLIVGTAIALVLARSITLGVRATARTATSIASGDLTQNVSIRSHDEIGDLGVAFNLMVERLRELTGEIRDAAESLAAATSEILASVTQQGASTSEQAASVAQMTATVDEVRVTAQQAIQKAQSVAAMARHSADVAEQGLRIVEMTVAGMLDIRGRVESIAEQILALSEQTQQIGEIIAAVDDLADQSNLLAVNAAIEASRAGEQGRGFAVVAQEVRRLAERSKAATVQVRTILTDIQRATNSAVLATEQGTKGTEEGAKLVEQAGQSIRHLSATIRDSAEAAQQIQAAIGQYSAGIDQIAVAMGNINQAVTETSAGSRQLQRAAENINDLVLRLTNMVGSYKLSDRAWERHRDNGRSRSGGAPVDFPDGAERALPGADSYLPIARKRA